MESIRMGSRHFDVLFIQKLKKVARIFVSGFQLLSYSIVFSHLVFSPYVHAGPAGGEVVGGCGAIGQVGGTTTINQKSLRRKTWVATTPIGTMPIGSCAIRILKR